MLHCPPSYGKLDLVLNFIGKKSNMPFLRILRKTASRAFSPRAVIMSLQQQHVCSFFFLGGGHNWRRARDRRRRRRQELGNEGREEFAAQKALLLGGERAR